MLGRRVGEGGGGLSNLGHVDHVLGDVVQLVVPLPGRRIDLRNLFVTPPRSLSRCRVRVHAVWCSRQLGVCMSWVAGETSSVITITQPFRARTSMMLDFTFS